MLKYLRKNIARWEPYDPTKVYQSKGSKLDFNIQQQEKQKADEEEESVLQKLARGRTTNSH